MNAVRRFVALAALLWVAMLAMSVAANADTGAVVGPQGLLTDTLLVSWLTSAALGWAIPGLTDLVTKASAPTWFKVSVVYVLSAIAAVIPTVAFTSGENWKTYLSALVVAFVTSQAAHRTGYSQFIQNATGDHGIGPSTDTAAPTNAPAPDDPLATDADAGDTGGTIPPEVLAINAHDLAFPTPPPTGGTA